MAKFKLIISYDGTDFCGWQVQPCSESIFSCLAGTFYAVFGRKVILVGPSRTDAGVHAFGYVASVQTDLEISSQQLHKAWGAALPESVHIRSLEPVADNYSPRHNIVKKIYYYHLFMKKPLPFVARFGWFYKFIDLIDLEKFCEALTIFEGKHDFRAFCRVDPGEQIDTVKIVDKISVSHLKRYGALQVRFEARGFLRYQIRRMMGAALEVARRPNVSLDYLRAKLDSGKVDNKFLTFCVPAKGLCLRKIIYKENGNDE